MKSFIFFGCYHCWGLRESPSNNNFQQFLNNNLITTDNNITIRAIVKG